MFFSYSYRLSRTKASCVLLTAFFFLPAATSASSQQGSNQVQQSQKTVSDSEKQVSRRGRHDEVTVTATRTATPVRSLGQSVTVVGADEIQAQGARTVQEVLETVVGFSVSRAGAVGATTSVFVRGGESNFNLVLIDGIPVNQAGGSFDFSDLSTANVERIEIVRGPASVLYGSQAVTSTIHIITQKGEGPPSGRLDIEGGSNDSYLLRGDLQGSTRRVRYSLAAHYSETDGFLPFNNGYDNDELSGNIATVLGGESTLTLAFRRVDSQFDFPTDFSGVPIDPNDFQQTDQSVVSLAYDNQLHSGLATRLRYGHYQRDFSSYTLADGITDFFDSTFTNKESRHYLDWQNDLQLMPSHRLTAGVSLEQERGELESESRRSLGVYLQEQFDWRQRVSVTAGARFTENNRFKDFLSASVAVSCLVTDELKLRASVGNGQRAPAFSEILGFPDFGIVGNRSLRPERNVAGDFGVDFFSRDGRFGFSATGYLNRFSDLIEFTFGETPGSPNYQNIEKAKSGGVELETFVRLSDRLRLGGNYTWTDTRVTDAGLVAGGGFEENKALLRRPQNVGLLYGEWSRNGYRVRLDAQFKGSREDIQFYPDFSSRRVTLPSYWKLDLAAFLPVVRWSDQRNLAFLLRGDNVLNRHYTEIAGFDSPGRTLSIGLGFSF